MHSKHLGLPRSFSADEGIRYRGKLQQVHAPRGVGGVGGGMHLGYRPHISYGI